MSEPFRAFDPSRYESAPNLNPATAIALVDALVKTQPVVLPPLAVRGLSRLVDVKGRISSELASRRPLPSSNRPPQEIDGSADRGWRAIRSCISGYLDLEPEFAPLQVKARQLDTLLFGQGGLAFTLLPYPEQRSAMFHRLDALKEHGLQKDLEEIVGTAAVNNLLHVVKVYDEMVMTMLEGVATNDESLGVLTRQVQKLAVDYARVVIATVDDEDPASVNAAIAALAPIDNMRRLTARGKTGPAPVEEEADKGTDPAVPVEPVVPAVPVVPPGT